MIDLITALESARSVAKFLEGDAFLEAVADVGLEASKTALLSAVSATDKRAQVWSAVNHLEHAEVAMRQQLSRRRGMMWVTAPGRAAHLMYKRQYLLCLLAACYRYLEEDELLRLTLESARNANTIRDETLRIPGTETMYSPDIVEFDINLVDYWRRDKASYRMQYAVDVDKFAEMLWSRPVTQLPSSESIGDPNEPADSDSD